MPATERLTDGVNSSVLRDLMAAQCKNGRIVDGNLVISIAGYEKDFLDLARGNSKKTRHAGEIIEGYRTGLRLTSPQKCGPSEVVTDKDFEKMLADESDDFGLGLHTSDRVEDPFTGSSSPLHPIMDEWTTSRAHPFTRIVTINGNNYGVVGTCKYTTADRSKTFDINCTTGNHRKLKDADESVLVYRNGRPVSLAREVGSNRFFLWLVHQKPNLTVRFWANVTKDGQRSDAPKGSHRMTLTRSGWVAAG